MSDSITIAPAVGPLQAEVRPPGSKSITNRALVCAALAKGASTLTGALVSDDTQVMIESLGRLGISVALSDNGTTLRVDGSGGKIPAAEAELFIGNSGTTIRFLTAMVSLGQGTYRLDGVPRMRERPIGDLVNALAQLRVEASCESPGGCPPVLVKATGLPGGSASVRGNISSQYLSGLLMAIPSAAGPVELAIQGELVSQPYVQMTLEVMRSFGVELTAREDLSQFTSPGGQIYQACDYAIEPDASAASYFWAAAAIVGGSVTVAGLSTESLQGDVAIVDLLEQMGCQVDRHSDRITVTGGKLKGISANMNAVSDMVQTIAAVALFAEGPTEITGVAHNRHKETDRIGALATELRKLGAEVDELEDGLRITPGPLRPASVETYDDHRMAMSLSLVGLKQPGIEILDPGCTSKTYPEFFDDMKKATSRS
ncbi:3-phosphoshikimate 1-carboxyvinyltransferase [Aeoliella mucimassa]|uniref:3-phosphoshikimate 1-carboxyvinyltransferase n=1 Tax=Aeoliella mucimassa TaxID=2527972 RepID=A0A518AP14_9BACT|nr:3-phosphoshikimate 1-carboxyvinyltransferase [Aeoliella mucimassa]QDU56463.1 3-phosphoshikimate 1-carboxyvinyltransferase [Aeoliella mucimassa]